MILLSAIHVTYEPQVKYGKSALSCPPPPNTIFAELMILRFLVTILVILAAWLLMVVVGTTPLYENEATTGEKFEKNHSID